MQHGGRALPLVIRAIRTPREVALEAQQLGYSVIPPTEDGAKKPLSIKTTDDEGKIVWTWKPFQTEPADRDQIEEWYRHGRDGVGLATGYGGLECLDFDQADAYRQYKAAAEALGLSELVHEVEAGYLESTPKGGRHWLYFCNTVGASAKLAERIDSANPLTRIPLVESRGVGGYVVIAPSGGRVHPSGKPYRLIQGSLDTVVRISPEQRQALWDLARSLDEIPDPDPPPAKLPAQFRTGSMPAGPGRPSTRYPDAVVSPIDAFNEQHSPSDVLQQHGWTLVRQMGAREYWKHPTTQHKWSATVTAGKRLKVFSTATVFATGDGKGYGAFDAYCALNHDGDVVAAVRTLAQSGYGTFRDNDGTIRPNPVPRGWKRTESRTESRTETRPNPKPEDNGEPLKRAIPDPSALADQPIVSDKLEWLANIHNSRIWLRRQGLVIQFDTFKQTILVDGESLTDEMVIGLTARLERSIRRTWKVECVRSALVDMAQANPFSSLTRWLDGLTWDGTPRIYEFFTKCFGSEASDYAAECARIFFISAVARAYQPGCKADIMPVLMGFQDIGKSSGMALLCPDPSWFCDDLGCDLHDRKSAEGLRGKWLIEWGEFSRISRTTSDVYKSFLSRQVDWYRPAYARTHRDFPRQCAFFGSTNNRQPLLDEQNRRFMPLWCTQADFDLIAEIRDQLWAEAVFHFRDGEKWWITDHAINLNSCERQEEARNSDAWEMILSESIGNKDEVTLGDVMCALKLTADRLDRSLQTRYGLCLSKLGFERKRRREDGILVYYWVRTPYPPVPTVPTRSGKVGTDLTHHPS
jgi:hypothetical protein